MDLQVLGWDEHFDKASVAFRSRGLAPARVVREHKARYEILGTGGVRTAKVAGRLIHTANSRADFPAVGDWVCVDGASGDGPAIIHAILPRKSKFSRKVAGVQTEEQVVAANIDLAVVVCAFGRELNPRRIERYLTLAWESGASPLILVNKADLCEDAAGAIASIDAVAVGVPVLVASALRGTGLDALRDHLKRGATAAFLGSSGVGKSTIINHLLGEAALQVGEVRPSNGKGRHVTTSRHLVLLESGGMIIDTPGMREIQLWAGEDGLDDGFEDVQRIAGACRFRDCTHRSEPGCAVKEAIEEGRLDPDRLKGYMKLRREIESLALRRDVRARLQEKSKWKKIAKWSRQLKKHDPKRSW